MLETVRLGAYGSRFNAVEGDGSVLTCLGRLVRLYKYQGQEEIGPILGGWLAESLRQAPWADRLEAVVSVPTHWRRRLSRPLHVADVLASVVSKRIGLPHVRILRRTRAGPHQIGLKYRDRVRNVRGAFALRKGVTLDNSRLLLIDDVRTIGATINECASVLRGGGAAEVYAAVAVTVRWDPPAGRTPRALTI